MVTRGIKVGDRFWVYRGDNSRWRRTRDPRDLFERVTITRETSRSWVYGPTFAETKVPKNRPDALMTDEMMVQRVWLDSFSYPIGDAVRRCKDYAILRKIADLVGWVEPKT